MQRTLIAAVLAALLPLSAMAESNLTHEAGLPAYENALKSYMCVDYDKAFRLFSENAEKGHALSQYMVGIMLGDGQGTQENDKAAHEWFMRAARQNLVDAYYALGDMYKKGEGVAKDTTQAVFWYDLAAKGGHKLANDQLAGLTPVMLPEQMERVRQQVADWMAGKPR